MSNSRRCLVTLINTGLARKGGVDYLSLAQSDVLTSVNGIYWRWICMLNPPSPIVSSIVLHFDMKLMDFSVLSGILWANTAPTTHTGASHANVSRRYVLNELRGLLMWTRILSRSMLPSQLGFTTKRYLSGAVCRVDVQQWTRYVNNP